MNNANNLFSSPLSFAGLKPPYSDLNTAKVVILPVPYDGTTEWHAGTRHGPEAIIHSSQYLELYDIDFDKELHTVGIHTLGPLQPVLNSPEAMIQRVYEITKNIIQKDKFTVMLGGEHSLSLGTVRALQEKYEDISVLQLDAHADLRDEYSGTKYSHACIMRRLFECCDITQVGIRSLSLEEQQFINKNDLKLFHNSSLKQDPESIQRIADCLHENVYITVDLDVFDPSIMSAVGTPEPDGLLWDEVLNLVKIVAEQKQIIGFDLMELCPTEGPDACAFLAAKLAYKMIGHVTKQ
jgi:agmatinase